MVFSHFGITCRGWAWGSTGGWCFQIWAAFCRGWAWGSTGGQFFTDAFVCVPQLSPDLQVDYESYKWTKLNPDNEADKKTINDYFRWEGDFGGKKFNQGKIFK